MNKERRLDHGMQMQKYKSSANARNFSVNTENKQIVAVYLSKFHMDNGENGFAHLSNSQNKMQTAKED